MIVVYVVGIVFIVFMFIFTLPYKKTLRKKLNKKDYRLKLLYGMSMFVADRMPKKIIYRNTKINNLIRELYVKEDIKKRKVFICCGKNIRIYFGNICFSCVWSFS